MAKSSMAHRHWRPGRDRSASQARAALEAIANAERVGGVGLVTARCRLSLVTHVDSGGRVQVLADMHAQARGGIEDLTAVAVCQRQEAVLVECLEYVRNDVLNEVRGPTEYRVLLLPTVEFFEHARHAGVYCETPRWSFVRHIAEARTCGDAVTHVFQCVAEVACVRRELPLFR